MQLNKEYLLILLNAILVALSAYSMNIYAIALSSVSLCLSIFIIKLWYIFDAILFKKSKVVQVSDNYEFESERLTATKIYRDGFTAIACARLSGPPKNAIDNKRIEGIIAHTNAPFRFVVEAERMDSKKIVDGLKTKRAMREIAISKVKSKEFDSARAKILEREIAEIDGEIKSITSGAMPLKLNTYLLTVAASENKVIATERAKSQIKEISGEFSAILEARFEVIEGKELISLLAHDMVNRI